MGETGYKVVAVMFFGEREVRRFSNEHGAELKPRGALRIGRI